MAEFYYTPDLTGMTIIKTDLEQNHKFFCDGHPRFLIPDFSPEPGDVWNTYMDYIENVISKEIYDQEGGEITHNRIIDYSTGLTECTYEAYGISFEEDGEFYDYVVKLKGYVAHKDGETYFIATYVDDGLN